MFHHLLIYQLVIMECIYINYFLFINRMQTPPVAASSPPPDDVVPIIYTTELNWIILLLFFQLHFLCLYNYYHSFHYTFIFLLKQKKITLQSIFSYSNSLVKLFQVNLLDYHLQYGKMVNICLLTKNGGNFFHNYLHHLMQLPNWVICL